MEIDRILTPEALRRPLERLFELSADKIRRLTARYDHASGSPVFTVAGRYTSRGWTEWTQGFEYGSALLQYEACGDNAFLEIGRTATRERMAPHLTHTGVHDHGFNNVSTYGNLLRLMNEGIAPEDPGDRALCETALKCSGAVQVMRWSPTADGGGFIYSFNGPHSLFADTIRSLRSPALAHRLGHVLMGENDRVIPLAERLILHARTTARYAVYYGTGRDAYDVRGRVAHESIFNPNDGAYRCPNSQQGYSPFTTWTRGLAWIMCGFAEQLEFLRTLDDDDLRCCGSRDEIEAFMLEAAVATCDYYLATTPADGIPYWDTGAPGLVHLPPPGDGPADPFNRYEPVDSSAAAIAAQGLLRLGHYLGRAGREPERASRYGAAGLTILRTLSREPYLSTDPDHEGLILHSVYHRPNGWDVIPDGASVPCGESSMWGDYHAREAALLVLRMARNQPYLTFWGDDE